MRKLVTGLAAVAMALASPAQAQIEQAEVSGGTVAGTQDGDLSIFKGIPFAESPTGDLRWKAPQPVVPWVGVKQTTRFGAACMQEPGLARAMGTEAPLSEDCLFIDVWSPAKSADEKLPVIAWIYGGGFNSGATSVPLYDGAAFARQGVVFVSIAYRVGMFGFLATPELSAESGHGSGNYGMLDQIAGLRWVQDNIAQFGGDPDQVTIMGHSAGGFAVSMLAGSPLAAGLFDGVISQSGGNFTPPQSEPWGGSRSIMMSLAEADGSKWLGSLGAETLEQARALPASLLEEAQHRPGAPLAQPPVDSYVLRGDQLLMWEQGQFNDVPVLLGVTSDETSVFGGKAPTAAEFEARIRRDYGAKADAILATYPHATDAQAADSARELANETGFLWNTFTWARLQAEHGEAPAYAYWFHRPNERNPRGSGHGSEVALVFDNEDTRPGRTPWTGEDRALSKQLQSYWVNFAKTGDPNGVGLPNWPAFVPGKPTVLKLGEETRPIAVPAAERLKLLDEYFAWRRGGG